MGQSFPTATPSYNDTQGGETLGSAGAGNGLSRILDDYGLDLTATTQKIGTGESTPTINKVLAGSGVGTSVWSSTLAGLTLTSPVINTPTGIVKGDVGLGNVDNTSNATERAATATLTNKTLTTPQINTINEETAANGVTIDGLNIKDGKLNTANSVVTTNLTDGIVTNAKLSTAAGEVGGAYLSYIPVVTGVTGGTMTAEYTMTGKTVTFNIRYIIAGGTFPSGAPTFTLPVTATSFFKALQGGIIGNVSFTDSGAADYSGVLRINSTTVCAALITGTKGLLETVTASAPFTWANGDEIQITGRYQAA